MRREKVATDAQGKIACRVAKEFLGARFYVVRRAAGAAWRDETEYLGAFRHENLALEQPSGRDLGDVRLVEEPVLVSGRVVDEEGKPLAGVPVRCGSQFYALPYNGRMSGSGSGSAIQHYVVTSKDGRFALRENGMDPDVIHLQIQKKGYTLPAEKQKFDGRQKDIEIVLYRSNEVVGSFAEFPKGVESWSGGIVMWPDGEAFDRNNALSVSPTKGRDFRFKNVITGRYQIGIVLHAQAEPAHLIQGIIVGSDGTVRGDGLDAIDWRAFAQCVRIEVEGPDGEALLGVECMQFHRRSGRGLHSVDGGRSFVAFLQLEGAKLEFRHKNHQTVVVEPPFADRKIVMMPKRRLRLSLKNPPVLPADIVLDAKVVVRRAGPRGSQYHGGRSKSVFNGEWQADLAVPGSEKSTLVFILFSTRTLPNGRKLRQSGLDCLSIDFEIKAGAKTMDLPLTLTGEQLEEIADMVENLKSR